MDAGTHQVKMIEQEEISNEDSQANRVLLESIALGFTRTVKTTKGAQDAGHIAINLVHVVHRLQKIAGAGLEHLDRIKQIIARMNYAKMT